ncbi:MAG: circadian clock protein KaiC [Bryobacteraceae bacterium]
MNVINDRMVEKIETGIPGLDPICCGGFPLGRTTLVSGTTGSAKTVFAAQFLTAGIARKQNGVFVTFEESPDDIRKNMMSLGWDIAKLEAEGKWTFVDASPQPESETVLAGEYDFGALLARIEHAVRKVNAHRISLDSLGTVFTRFPNPAIVRHELFRISQALKMLRITAVLTAERTEDYGSISRYSVEEFVADNVIILRNPLGEEKRRRTLEILKFRGTAHQKGEFPFTIASREGVVVLPLPLMELKQPSSQVRISSGCKELDQMCGGGLFQNSVILVSGATGTGKTLAVSHFVAGANHGEERCLLFAYEESREQLFRNGTGWGFDLERLERENRLQVQCTYPESEALEDHFIRMKNCIAEFRPTRVAVDSLSALERVSSVRGFREFVNSLTSYLKQEEITGLFTSTTPSLLAGTSVTEAHISTVTDSIVLLRYVELYGEMRRGITVLKMRGSAHDKEIRQFSIDGRGIHIGKPFRNISGILSGNFLQVVQPELQRFDGLFEPEAPLD